MTDDNVQHMINAIKGLTKPTFPEVLHTPRTRNPLGLTYVQLIALPILRKIPFYAKSKRKKKNPDC